MEKPAGAEVPHWKRRRRKGPKKIKKKSSAQKGQGKKSKQNAKPSNKRRKISRDDRPITNANAPVADSGASGPTQEGQQSEISPASTQEHEPQVPEVEQMTGKEEEDGEEEEEEEEDGEEEEEEEEEGDEGDGEGAEVDDENGGDDEDAAKKQEEALARRSRKRSEMPYTLEQSILLVGEGNFSFAHALATVIRAGSNILATSLDSLAECQEKYSDCEEHIKPFEKLGGTVVHQVDGTKLEASKVVKSKKFDVIVFNFPHAGTGIKDQERNIAANRELLLRFFASASRKLNKNGEIHVTLRTGLPYSKWNAIGLAERTGRLSLKRTLEFDPLLYPGYAHRNTVGFFKGVSTDFNQHLTKQNCKTFIFGFKWEVAKAKEEQAKAKQAKLKATLGRGKKRKMKEAALKQKKRGAAGGARGGKRRK